MNLDSGDESVIFELREDVNFRVGHSAQDREPGCIVLVALEFGLWLVERPDLLHGDHGGLGSDHLRDAEESRHADGEGDDLEDGQLVKDPQYHKCKYMHSHGQSKGNEFLLYILL